MLPTFVNPLAFWGFLSLIAVAGIYFFRNRVKEVKVSSLMLWHNKSNLAEGGKVLDKIKLPLLLIIELIIFALLLLAAASPRLILGDSVIPMVLILDNSISMTAPAEASPQSQALEFLKKQIFLKDYYRISILKAGISSEFVGRRGMAPAEAWQYLQHWKCNSPTADLNLAIKTTSENFPGKVKTLVVTDQPSQISLSDSINWLHFGATVKNLAITAANRYSLGKLDRCYLEFSNFSNDSEHLKAVIGDLATGKIIQNIDEQIGSKSFRRIRFSIPKDFSVFARIENDKVSFDNEVFLLANLSRKVSYSIKSGSEYLKAILERTLSQIDFAEKVEKSADIVFTQDELLDMDHGWNLVFHTASQPWLFNSEIAARKNHFLADGLSFDKSFWAISANASMSGSPIINAGQNILLSIEGAPERSQTIHFNYCAEYSDLHNTYSWPILFWNLFDWKLKYSDGPSTQNAKAGMGVKVKLSSSVPNVVLIKPDGQKEKLEFWGQEAEFEPELSGLYQVVTENSSWTIAANLTDAIESNFLHRTHDKANSSLSTDEFIKESADVRWWFLLPAIFFFFIHQWLLSRRRIAYA